MEETQAVQHLLSTRFLRVKKCWRCGQDYIGGPVGIFCESCANEAAAKRDGDKDGLS